MANEKRLIDANALIDEWNKLIKRMVRDKDGKTPVDFGLVIREVSKAPTVDAVEVVRCRDCFANGCCSIQIDLDMGGEGYCPKGRKETQ